MMSVYKADMMAVSSLSSCDTYVLALKMALDADRA